MTSSDRDALYNRIAEETTPGGAMALRIRIAGGPAQGQAEETLAALCDRIDELECRLLDHCAWETKT